MSHYGGGHWQVSLEGYAAPPYPTGASPYPSAPSPNMIGTGVGVNFATEFFHPPTPVSVPVNGFGVGHRLRLVGVPTPGATRFEVNLHTPNDIAFHFNPRFNEHCVVRNNTKGGGWQREERYAQGFPFEHGKIFTLEFIAQPGQVQIFLNGRLFTQFAERDNPHAINRISVGGDVHIHSVHVSSG